MLKRIPIVELLAEEIEKGEINKSRLEEKVAAFLEFVNNDFNAFDAKTGQKNRITFNDAVVVSFNKNKLKIPISILSPRFEKGKYVAKGIKFGIFIGDKAIFDIDLKNGNKD